MTLKQTFLITFGMAATLLMAGCSQEKFPDVPDDSGAQPFRISVTDGGYASDGTGKSDTRAVENGYTTEFTAGDACGLYIVRSGGNVAYDNVKLTATAGKDGTLAWQPEEGVNLIGGYTGETYFLYYPYQPDMTGKTDAASTSSDSDFFAPLISGWQPAADQSTYAKYTACDLMTAKGSATKNTDDGKLLLAFSMTHRMALAVIDVPRTVYRFTNTDVSNYVVADPVDFTGSDVNLWRCGTDGTYRCIMKPASSTAVNIIGSYNKGEKEFMATPSNIAAGSCKCYVVDGAPVITKDHLLQPGDYYLADGHLLPKDAILTDEEKKKIIGIVFRAGHHESDLSDYSSTGIKSQDCHGYAVALQDATTTNCMWGVAGQDLECCPKDADGNKIDSYHYYDCDWNGCEWIQKIITAAGGKENLKAIKVDGYPATYYAVMAYENSYKAYTGSSGWFLPSVGQLCCIYHNKDALFGSGVGKDLVSGEYWSSSEGPRNGEFAICVYVNASDYVVNWSKNRAEGRVRSVLAF